MVTLIDLDILGRYYGTGSPLEPPSEPIPEPATLALLLLGSLALLRKRPEAVVINH